jgi:glycosyltransferase 2 family protein
MLKRVGVILLKAGITLGLFYVLVTRIDLNATVGLMAATDWRSVLVIVGVMVLQVIVAVFRWYRIMISKGVHISVRRSARFFWLGLFFNQLLPSSIGGDAIRGYCLVRDGQSVGRATLSVLLDRILGMAGLVVLIVLAIPYAMNLIKNPEMQWGMMSALLVVIAGFIAILFIDIFTRRFSSWRVMKGLTTLASDARQLLGSRQGLGLVLFSVLIHILSIVVVGMLSSALSIKVDWIALTIIVPITTLLITIPLSIAGWGVREGVMVVGLGYVGIAPEEAFALSILYGLLTLVVALPGVLAWLTDPAVRSLKVNKVVSLVGESSR